MLSLHRIPQNRLLSSLGGWWWAAALGLALLAVAKEGQNFLHAVGMPPRTARDFFQEWASAKNIWTGLPIYAPHEQTIPLYLGQPAQVKRGFVSVNAHPPVSVLLAWPLTAFDYPVAHFLWNLITLAALALSIAILVRSLDIRLDHRLAIIVLLVLLSSPMHQHLRYGQLTLVILLLVTGTWWADRSGHSGWAGTLLGLATAIKVFPGLLFMYFALRRRWHTLICGVASLALLSLAVLPIMGADVFLRYAREALPQVAEWRADAWNCSWPGLCCKLFNPGSNGAPVQAMAQAPALASGLSILGCALIVLLLVPVIWRARSLAQRDLAFALVLVAMLLISPVTWDHYLLLLALPFALLWKMPPPKGLLRWLFLSILFVTWVHRWRIQRLPDFLLGRSPSQPPDPAYLLTIVSLHLYALLGVFALIVLTLRRAPSSNDPHRPATTGSHGLADRDPNCTESRTGQMVMS